VILKSVLQNAGQTCSAGSRLLVHSDVRDAVLAGLGELLARVTMGAGPNDPDLGPLISAKQLARVTAMVERAAEGGATRLGDHAAYDVPDRGFFFPPTLFADVDPTAEIARDEVFGPVVAATTFETLEEAVALANGTEYGLIAAVWTKNLDVAHTMAEEIRAGQVYLNTYGAGGGVEYPFGGFKKSGYGREKGYEALGQFCQTKSVILKLSR
jgi:aldehyde dehydrogenase (NAD+)